MVLDKLRQKVAGTIWRGERATQAWEGLHREGGLIPLLNMTDTEARLKYLRGIMEAEDFSVFDPDKQKGFVKKVYATFFLAGDAWFRGLDNRELAQKVVDFLANFSEVGYMDEFIPDLFEEALQLISLSFQALDVTPTPMIIVESKPVILAGKGGKPEATEDAGGVLMMKQRIDELERQLAERGKK